MFKRILKETDGSAVLGIISSLVGGFALLIATQLFSGVSKANADITSANLAIAELRTKEAIDIADLKKDVSATRAGIDVMLDLQGKDNPKVLKYRVQYPNQISVASTSTAKK